MSHTELSSDQSTVTISLPLAIRSRGGRKQVVSPDGSPTWPAQSARIDTTLVKALARAFRWRRLLEDGVYATIAELAAAEKINASYVSRVLRLTVLSPDIVDAILHRQHTPELTFARLFRPFPADWEGQAGALLANKKV
ncbi:MAG: hypothetical protein H0T75_22515 [Rhizobiales bacterium]|nr:hypothetical protein [Hyphomicrobiales bacterium]